ncbi:hypothetical protein P4N68_06675 [Corynebacterium felinum]|uniref:Uncharacterized protein n=1 Tax=Corynebacterium felinum TaxID=131318 RepID=A0ABU2B6D4_9CORY|nr:hypothetical protein [Corynebacterium felinum]MDF5820765.1 hypothetical protein [Corynebacterium felinum]MDR7354181.1 hypothetical protein [Corynebacterium felinum]
MGIDIVTEKIFSMASGDEMLNLTPGNRFLFMSAGPHGGQTLEEILERKQEEIRSVGYCFWGYGGSLGSPVKPLLKGFLESAQNSEINVYMRETNSNPHNSDTRATEYSTDGKIWFSIPQEIDCTGSNYPLLLARLDMINDELDIAQCEYFVAGSLRHGSRIRKLGQADQVRKFGHLLQSRS